MMKNRFFGNPTISYENKIRGVLGLLYPGGE